MQDLHALFEQTTLESLNNLSAMMEDGEIEKNADKIWDIIFNMYYSETGIELDHEQIGDEKVNGLFNSLMILTNLYISVRMNRMIIKEGRIKISDPDECKFSLNDKGINYVEKLIGKP